ncbi:MAG: ATP synthase F0 subunit C [Myxococcales bacterium]|nr:MAG: ATP synthase F0 subunit C [Myxococcales bacterium]
MKKLLMSIFAGLASLLYSSAAFAAAEAGEPNMTMGYIALAAGLGIGLAAFGGALGQGRAAAAALEGIARNPQASGKILTPMIIGLALVESLVIYAFVITIMLVFKVNV